MLVLHFFSTSEHKMNTKWWCVVLWLARFMLSSNSQAKASQCWHVDLMLKSKPCLFPGWMVPWLRFWPPIALRLLHLNCPASRNPPLNNNQSCCFSAFMNSLWSAPSIPYSVKQLQGLLLWNYWLKLPFLAALTVWGPGETKQSFATVLLQQLPTAWTLNC